MNSKFRFFLFLSVFFLGLSFLISLPDRFSWAFRASDVPNISEEVATRKPVGVVIERAGIDIGVVDGNIENGKWLVSDKKVNYLTSSSFPGGGGNIVIYGHNKWDIFGKLVQVKVGDEIKIETDDGKNFEYEVFERLVVEPTRIDLVSPTDEEILTLYTCTGVFDRQRLVLRAKPSLKN